MLVQLLYLICLLCYTKRLIETGVLIESVLGRPVEQEDIEPIKQLIEYYRNRKLSGQTYSDKK